ncbi:hypothetical protein DFH07DRAFT_377371 [Mycena maculata]|uniref:Uncharacterized protein n=1 Tax=Mycena maculata TaxID=230809 RepID=A0AAD7JGR0_9AGAR|nr:hypothetical protein DFH07DRAFT_377371 [Mycena maculata]
MRFSIAFCLASVAAALAVAPVAQKCAACGKEIKGSDNAMYKFEHRFPDVNTTLCIYEEKREDKKPKNQGFCSYNNAGVLIKNPDDLTNCPAGPLKMEDCKEKKG